jgi:signal transduction histidine kinase
MAHPDDALIASQHQQALLSGKTDVCEFRIIAKSGQTRWLRDYGRPVWDETEGRVVRIYGASQDITERKKGEEEIRELNRDLERRARELAAINAASRVMASTLDPQRVLEMVIGEVKSLLDAECASVMLRDPVSDDLVFAAAAGPGSERLSSMRMPITLGIAGWVVRERQPALVADARQDARFYSRIDAVTGLTTISLAAVPLKFKGAVWGVVEAINKAGGAFSQRDCKVLEALASSAAIAIENARLYSSLQETNTQLRVALQAKDEMIQNVSHELRTPLGLIYGYIGLLEDGTLGALSPEQEKSVQIMHHQGDRLRFMVERLLTLQALDAGRLRRVKLDMSSWLRQTVAPWEVRATQAGIRLQIEIPASLPAVIGDPDFLGQVIENLLNNALKFTPRNGEVRARAHAEKDQVVIVVSDTGVGIPPDRLQHVFERFYQVDGSPTRRFGGMGIGLALCRAIMEAHGGQIWAESAGDGQGSAFYVALPILTIAEDEPGLVDN